MFSPLLAAALAVTVSAAPPPAVLRAVVGKVEVQSGGKTEPGKDGRVLAEGDTLISGAGASAVVELADGTKLKLAQRSRAKLSLPKPKAPQTTIELLAGGVFAKVAKRAREAEFRVRAQEAVAAVRGTRFFTAYGRGADLWVCVDEGAVNVSAPNADRPLAVPAGKGILIKGGKDLTKPQAYDWTKKLNWNMDAGSGDILDRTDLDKAYSDLLDQDYR